LRRRAGLHGPSDAGPDYRSAARARASSPSPEGWG